MTQQHRSNPVDERLKLSASPKAVDSAIDVVEQDLPGLTARDEIDALVQNEDRHNRSEALFRLLNVFMPMPADLIEFVLDHSCGEPRFRKRTILP